MTKQPILKKPSRKGSLVRRVLWGMTFFVVLPLFIHTFFLYFREYQEDVGMVKTFLELIARAATESLEEVTKEKKTGLGESCYRFGSKANGNFRDSKNPCKGV